jgi:putative ABC transport system substrate-binding protein
LAQETRTIPIVFVRLFDPVETGLVTSLSRPGGNITGFTLYDSSLTGKWVELLKEMADHVTRAAIVHYPETKSQALMLSGISAAAPSLGIRPIAIGVHDGPEIERALTDFASEPNGGLIALPSPITISNRELIIALAARHRMPAVYPFRFFASEGGLISYGADLAEQYRQGVAYVDRVLKGAKVGELPVQQASKFELVINLDTARALGLTVPPRLLARATEVIE